MLRRLAVATVLLSLVGCVTGDGGPSVDTGGMPVPAGVQSLPATGRLTVAAYVDAQTTPVYQSDVTPDSATVSIQLSAPQGEHVFTVLFTYEDPDFAAPDGKPWEIARWTSDEVQVESDKTVELNVSTYTYADTNGDGVSNLDQLIARTDPGAPPVGNRAPVAQAGSLTLDQDTTGQGTLAASDADSDPLTFSIVAAPAHGTAVVTDAATGAYTYTPAAGFSGDDSFSFKANDGQADSSAAVISVIVKSVTVPAPPIPGQIEAEDYNQGGQQVAYFDTTPGNSGGAYRNDDVDIEPTTDDGGGYDVGWIEQGEWLKYNVDIQAAGRYDIAFRVARQPRGTSALHLEVDGTDVTGIVSVPSTRDWQRFTTVTARGISLPAGAHVLRLYFDESEINVNWMAFTPSQAAVESPDGLWRAADGQGDDVAILEAGRIAMRSGGLIYSGTYAVDDSRQTYAGTVDVYDSTGAKLTTDPVAFAASRADTDLTLTLDGAAPAPATIHLVYDAAYEGGADLSRVAQLWTSSSDDGVLLFPIASDGQIAGAADTRGCGYSGTLTVPDPQHDAYAVSLSLDSGCGSLAGDGYAGYAALSADGNALILIVSNGTTALVLALISVSI